MMIALLTVLSAILTVANCINILHEYIHATLYLGSGAHHVDYRIMNGIMITLDGSKLMVEHQITQIPVSGIGTEY